MKSLGMSCDAPGTHFLSGAAHYYDTYATSDGKFISIGPLEQLGAGGPQFGHGVRVSDVLEIDQNIPDAAAHAGGRDGEAHHRVSDGVWIAVPHGDLRGFHGFVGKARGAQRHLDRQLEALLHSGGAQGLLFGEAAALGSGQT